jgi:hypothetical protein
MKINWLNLIFMILGNIGLVSLATLLFNPLPTFVPFLIGAFVGIIYGNIVFEFE